MKKYITTSKHPNIKKDIIFVDNEDNSEFINSALSSIFLLRVDFKRQIELEFFIELQEPKWTDDDMIEFVKYYNSTNEFEYEKCLENWKKQ